MKRNKAFSNKLLKALVIGGVVTITAVNPFFGVVASYIVREELKRRKWKRFQDDLYYLKRRGLIDMEQNSTGRYIIKSTAKGRCQVQKYDLGDISIKAPKKWDQYWRLIIFDIPATKQKARLALLAKLKELGFIMLQRSIWAHPFECQNEIAILAKAFEVKKYVQYLTCNKVSADANLRSDFEKRNNIKLS